MINTEIYAIVPDVMRLGIWRSLVVTAAGFVELPTLLMISGVRLGGRATMTFRVTDRLGYDK